MKIIVNPLGKMVNDYLMKWAMALAAWFIIEYLVRNASSTYLLLNFFSMPMMLVTLVAIWWILRKLRREVLGDMMLGIQAWSFGVQLCFFAGLIESLFIYVFNQYLVPGNLAIVQQNAIQQYEEVLSSLEKMGAYQSWLPKFQETLSELKEAPILSPIETAINSLSNEILFAILFMIPMAFILRKRPMSRQPE